MRRTASAQSIRRAHAVEEIGPAHSTLLSSPSDKVGSPVSLALGRPGGGARSIFEGSRKQAGGAAPLDMRARLLKAQHLFSAEKSKGRPAARPETAPAGSPSCAKESENIEALPRASPRIAALAAKNATGSPAAAAAASPSSPQSSPVAPLVESLARKR
jgi:hypothetical protein